MKENTPELIFENRAAFRLWLAENAASSGGVWLVFGKTKALKTLSAAEALEEALCFGWIDGQMSSIDNTKYIKYFAPRQAKSVWSEKNKASIPALREKGLMTELGEAAVAAAIKNGSWDVPKGEPVTDEKIAALDEKVKGSEPAYANWLKMPPSVKKTYTGLYNSMKSDEARERTLLKIIDRLNKNLKPMEKE